MDDNSNQAVSPQPPETSENPEPVVQESETLSNENIKQAQLNGEDAKLESRLTIKDLEALQGAFNFKGDTFERLCLNREQFIQALSIILNKGTEDEYAELFDKIDISKQDRVSWDQLAQHMLLQFYEKDDKVKSSQLPQWKDVHPVPVPHKDVIQRIDFLKGSFKYITVSREGTISMLNSDLELHRTMRATTDSCKQRDLWVTDFAVVHSLNKIAVAFTSKEIAFYDISSKSDFSCQCRVEQLDASPLCLDFWHSQENPNDAVLCWGDIKGNVNAIFFLSATINLFERQSGNSSEDKQETTLVVKLKDIKNGKFVNSNKFISHTAHSDWTRKVRYINGLECFISCATTWDDSVVIGWIEKRTTLSSQVMSVKKPDFELDHRSVQRLSKFQVHQGINSFDLHEGLNLIATAGANNHVCLWNPYVVSKPNGVLTGHVAPVLEVLFNTSKGQVLSFSKDKVLRIWDVQLQVCLQRLAGIFPKGPEVTTKLYLQESRGRLFLSFNNSLHLLEMKAEVKDRILSHDKPITATIFNTQLNQVLTGCQAGTLTFWLIDSGQRLRSIPNAHGTAEITALTNDPTEPRFYSGGTDGIVQVRDWNGHVYHELDCNMNGLSAEVSQILVLKHGIVVTGFSKDVVVFRTNAFKDFRVKPGEWKDTDQHQDDLLSVAFFAPHNLITGSYDGEIVVWNINSEICTRHMQQRSTLPQTAASRGSSASSSNSRRSKRSATASGAAAAGGIVRRMSARERMAAQDSDSNFTISRLCSISNRKGKNASCANLISCGANGYVRFWNLHHGTLVAEFQAHKQTSSIIMKVTPDNAYLVTADSNGNVKVWEIGEYCDGRQVHSAAGGDDGVCNQMPPLHSEWQAHIDQINDMDFAHRQQRTLLITVSADCSASVWDLMGNLVGIFGQEEHWKIDHLSVILERQKLEMELQQAAAAAMAARRSNLTRNESADTDTEHKPKATEADNWQPDDRAVSDPSSYRLSAWDESLLGSRYKELGSQRRQRKQPNVIPNLPFLAHDRHTPSIGPFSNLDISKFSETRDPKQPDFMKNPDAYFRDKDNVIPGGDKMPILAETLKAAFDDRSLFPKYILDYESHMKKYQHYATSSAAAAAAAATGTTIAKEAKSKAGSHHSNIASATTTSNQTATAAAATAAAAAGSRDTVGKFGRSK